MLKMHLLKYSWELVQDNLGCAQELRIQPGYRTRASFANSTKERVNLEHRQVSPRFYLPNKRQREILYSEIRARAGKTQGKPETLNPCQGPSCSNCYCCFRLRSNVFLIVGVSSTPKCRLRSSLDRRKLFVNRCSFVTPVPWYFRTRRLRLIPLCILVFAAGN